MLTGVAPGSPRRHRLPATVHHARSMLLDEPLQLDFVDIQRPRWYEVVQSMQQRVLRLRLRRSPVHRTSRPVLLSLVAMMAMGCIESSFDLAPESRLPRWVVLPAGVAREAVSVALEYRLGLLSGWYVQSKLYKRGQWASMDSVEGRRATTSPIELEYQRPGFPRGYPSYEIVSVGGVVDIVEHRRMEPIFYMADDPEVWQELRRRFPAAFEGGG